MSKAINIKRIATSSSTQDCQYGWKENGNTFRESGPVRILATLWMDGNAKKLQELGPIRIFTILNASFSLDANKQD